MDKKSIVVVGGGWAGLACAIELSYTGHKVTLLESARQLGGRARRVAFNQYSVDNGQHILVGAYRDTLLLLRRLNVNLDRSLHRQALDLYLQDAQGKHCRLHTPHLFAPLNLLLGLITASGFDFRDRWSALRFGTRLFTRTLQPNEDASVAQLLRKHHQTARITQALWEPICLASLNTPIDEASAHVFIRVLQDTFCHAARDADLIIPKVDLGALLPDPALDFIEQHGGNIHLNHRVTSLAIEKRHVTGVLCNDKVYPADHVVLAIPPHACQPLVKSHAALHDVAYNLAGFTYQPICTVYLQFPANIKLDRPIQGLLGMTGQWIIDRRLCGQDGLFAVVISGPGPHMQMENSTLIETILQEIRQLYPDWPAAQDTIVIREKRATFNCRSEVNLIRPANRSRVQGLWFAGDYTQTGYPATIEGAVRSGLNAARQIHNEVVTAS